MCTTTSIADTQPALSQEPQQSPNREQEHIWETPCTLLSTSSMFQPFKGTCVRADQNIRKKSIGGNTRACQIKVGDFITR